MLHHHHKYHAVSIPTADPAYPPPINTLPQRDAMEKAPELGSHGHQWPVIRDRASTAHTFRPSRDFGERRAAPILARDRLRHGRSRKALSSLDLVFIHARATGRDSNRSCWEL
jgi:hypothetical protein